LAKGIDIQIERLQDRFKDKLWTSVSSTNKDYFGRIYRNERDGDVIPQRFVSGNDYKDVLLNDKKAVTCFFDVQPEESYEFQFNANVWILFAVNLKTLYPSITDRATEYVHEDVVREIKKIGGWNVTGLVRGLPAFADYSLVKDSDDMQPFYLFRINCEVKYPLNC